MKSIDTLFPDPNAVTGESEVLLAPSHWNVIVAAARERQKYGNPDLPDSTERALDERIARFPVCTDHGELTIAYDKLSYMRDLLKGYFDRSQLVAFGIESEGRPLDAALREADADLAAEAYHSLCCDADLSVLDNI